MVPSARRKRFFEEVAVERVEEGYRLALDGRPVNTPGGRALVVPTAALGEALAEEWRRQGDEVDPDDMPMTRLAITAIDHVEPARAEAIERLLRFGETDLLCYRVREPADLAGLQHRAWQPLLDWAAEALGARLEAADGIAPIGLRAEALEALCAALARRDSMTLAALGVAVPAAGSLVVGLALAEGRVDADEACEVAEIEEAYQSARWGEDEETLSRRRRVRAEMRAAAGLLALCRQGR